MALVRQCDKCGAYFNKDTGKVNRLIFENYPLDVKKLYSGEPRECGYVDLCLDCANEILKMFHMDAADY